MVKLQRSAPSACVVSNFPKGEQTAAAAAAALDGQQISTRRQLSVLSGGAAACLPFRIVGYLA